MGLPSAAARFLTSSNWLMRCTGDGPAKVELAPNPNANPARMQANRFKIGPLTFIIKNSRPRLLPMQTADLLPLPFLRFFLLRRTLANILARRRAHRSNQ